MIGGPWGAAALVCLHLNSLGGLPKEVPVDRVRPYVAGERQLRVLIAADCSTLDLRPASDATLEERETGQRLGVVGRGATLTVRRSGQRMTVTARGLRVSGQRIRLRPTDPDAETRVSTRGGWGRRGVYRGVLEITATPRGLRVVEHTDLETYLAGVVAAEMPASFPLEAVKAQAIAARTYALYHLGGHDAEEADVCARVHCQAYGGSPPTGSIAARAVGETAGRVLSWNGLLADALYHSACGGATAPAWSVRQGKLLPYLVGCADTPPGGDRASAYCRWKHDTSWSRRFSHREAERLICSNLSVVARRPDLSPRRLEGMRLTLGEPDGRAQWLKVYTDRGAYAVRGDAIRWLFGNGWPGPSGLRSTACEMSLERPAGARPDAYVFEGVGHGHGIGLCQWGSRGRAAAGQKAEEILAAYYPGTTVVDLGHELR